MSKQKASDIIDFNPKRPISKSSIAPFIDMAALPTDSRDVNSISTKEFKGGGAKFKNGDTLFARITPCLENGKTAKVSGLPHDVCAYGSTEFVVMSAKEDFYDEDFVYYLARLPEFREYAQSRMEGTSGRQRVPWQALAEFEYQFPDKDIRKKVGAILKSFDDKIENNRRMNETLERMAQAVFKSWFVDFEPTRAKMAALEAGGSEKDATLAAMTAISGKDKAALELMRSSSPESYEALKSTANLFPASLQDSELGQIPVGWEIKPVIKSAEYINGAAYKNMHFSNEADALPVIKIAELKNGITGNTKFTNTILDDKYRLYTGDILFSWSGSPDTSIDIFIWSLGPAWLNQHIFKVVNETVEGRCFTYWLLKYLKPTFIEIARDKQTTGLGHVTKRNMEQLHYCMPDNDVFQLFFEAVGSIMGQIENNMIEIQTLTQTRDALLPKLLSGEIDVSALSNMEDV